MKSLQAALWMETLKVRRTKVFPVSIYFFLSIGVLMGLLMFVTQHPEIASRSSTVKMKTSFLPGSGWVAFYGLLLQLILTLGVIGSGIITSWVFGREFSDRALKDLLALPVSRSIIVISKLMILFIWSILLALTILGGAILTGLLVKLPGWDFGIFWPFLTKYMVCAVLNIFLVSVVAFVASAGRGYILPIGFVILMIILPQFMFMGLPQLALWFPWALPALYSGVAGVTVPPPGLVSYMIYSLTVLAGLFGTMAWWRYADHK